ncbi:CD109 antigen [Amphibalanus amphitrite]|uniref:CD109 antigen n=1 Tax=Amphibalanus amphitrite TaxID=1232801 RepID=A0A6A4X152_AMPAM|nr:CD109 antigen [Amphibalanus amphitrite]
MYSVTRQLEAAASLPTACVLGEQLGLIVTLRSRANSSVTVNLVLAKSPRYRFVSLAEFGKQSGSVRRSDDALVEHRTAVALAARQTRTVTLPVEPLVTGTVTVTLYTEHQGVKHFLRETVTVRLPGVPSEEHTVLLADVTARPYLYQFLDVPRPHLVVPDSYRATVSLTGGVVGPWADAEDLPAAPRTADAALSRLLMTLYEMTYLAPERPRADALMSRLSTAYQSLLTFRRTDGGFALYSSDQPGSIWMTAHATLALAKLRRSPRRQRSLLDTKVLSSAVRWLLQAQQSSGLFREETVAADQRYNDTGDVMLTSHALMALTEVAKLQEDEDADIADGSETLERLAVPGLAEGVASATGLLSVRVRGSLTALQAALAALALAGGGGRAASDARELLSSQLRDEGEFMYWSREPHPLPAYRLEEHVPYLQPRRTFSRESENVLTTALALRAYVALGQHRTEPIVRWLQARKATDFGWIGYMDTLAVTEALLDYSKARHVQKEADIQMDVETAGGRDSLHTHDQTAGARQELQITDPSEGLKLRFTGSGVALAQLSVQYRLFSRKEESDILLDVDAGHHSPNGSHVTIGLCVRLSDLSERRVSGAVAVLADVPSGYGVSAAALRQYVHSGAVPRLVAAELTAAHRLQLVFSSLVSAPVCARITVVRWFAVTNMSRSLSAEAYPLHEPERRSSAMFDVSELSRYGLCDLCGSYQCGGCTASSRTSGAAPTAAPVVTLLVTLVLPVIPARAWR